MIGFPWFSHWHPHLDVRFTSPIAAEDVKKRVPGLGYLDTGTLWYMKGFGLVGYGQTFWILKFHHQGKILTTVCNAAQNKWYPCDLGRNRAPASPTNQLQRMKDF